MDFKHKLDDECGHHIEKNNGFCAPDHIVEKVKEINNIDGADGPQILEELKNKYNCKTEVCVLSHPEVKYTIGDSKIRDVIVQHFKPVGPRNSNAWLSNNNIDEVLAQIQKQYKEKNFFHICFQMIDFEKTKSELATLDWPKKHKEGFRSFGTVLNTDYSTGRGKHWFALHGSFQDTDDEFTIEYFNSSGELPMDEISMWMKKVKHEWQPAFDKPIKDVIVTRIENQQDDWNCGPYSLYYIISRIDGTDYKYFKNNKIGDDNMQLFRKFLFRDSNHSRN
jgi:hypothetical protein